MEYHNPKRCVGALQEYPGTTTWYDYEIKCVECGRWRRDYGQFSTEIDGKHYWLCMECGDRVWADLAEQGVPITRGRES